MKKKIHILVLLAFAICQNTFGQTTINDFEGDNSKIVERNGAKHSIIESSKVGQSTSLMLNNFEPGLPNTVARHGAAISVVANPLKDAINDTDNVIKVGRTGDKWFELFAFPVETYTIPANTTRYLSISVKYDAQPDIVIRVDGEDEFSNGDPTVAIRAINKYTDFGNWQKLYFPLEGGQNGAEIKAVIIFSDAGFTNSPSGYILNNTDKFGYLDEIAINETDGANNTQEEYLKSLKEELVVNWPNNRTINVVFHGHSIPSGYFQTPTVKTLESYPHKTLEKLSAKYPTAVINTIKTAIGGENSISGARRFEEDVLIHKADVILIDYSMNDRNLDIATVYNAWDEMIKKAQSRGIKVLLITSSPYRDIDLLSTETNLYKHQQQVIKLAQENNVGLVDGFQVFKQKVIDGNNVNSYLSSFNHPNAIGHNLIAEEIMKFF